MRFPSEHDHAIHLWNLTLGWAQVYWALWAGVLAYCWLIS